MFKTAIKKLSFINTIHFNNNSRIITKTLKMWCSNDRHSDSNKAIKISNKEVDQAKQLEDYLKQQQKSYSIIDRTYNQTKVPGQQQRLFSDLNQLQGQIISSNKFDLLHPEIKPKLAGINQYHGIEEKLMEISLGKVKIKNQNEVYLSEINVEQIPEDLDIKFDSQKQLKIVGKGIENSETQNQLDNSKQHSATSTMNIQNYTIEMRTFHESMQQQLGGFASTSQQKYSRHEQFRKFIGTFFLLFITVPFVDTGSQLYDCFNMISAIQAQKMTEIQKIKEQNYKKAILISNNLLKNDI